VGISLPAGDSWIHARICPAGKLVDESESHGGRSLPVQYLDHYGRMGDALGPDLGSAFTRGVLCAGRSALPFAPARRRERGAITWP
jgi:hypothetical protein